ncbi:MAG: hypothetical protein QOE90_1281 [Thermoplasmata archaeon]|jgi:uncharacterized protein YecE (DUF72 family)|nr:hypothetical protein [Thermoplasmata archaeon]
MTARVNLGLAGWGYAEWTGLLYAPGTPPGERLAAYARAFGFVENDATYYTAPTRADAARWAAQTPPGFRMSPKLPKRLVHEKLLADVQEEVSGFLAALAPLAAEGKLGPVLAQLPPSFRRDKHGLRLRAFLARWPRDVPLAVETRDPAWWSEDYFELLRAHGAIHVWAVTEYGRSPPVLTADQVYMRFVGDRALDAATGTWDRVRRDQSDEIARWAADLRRVMADVDEEWIVVNNHFTGYAPDAAMRVAEALGQRAPDLGLARGGGQRSLGAW